MRFHAHITTLDNYLYTPVGWKRTEILLEKDSRKQTDIMFTKHYVIDKKGIGSIQDILDDIESVYSIGKTRVKIEQDDEFFLLIDEKYYMEVHLLCPEGVTPPGDWVRSKNPRSLRDGVPQFFFNRRIYFGGTMQEEIEKLNKELKGVPYSELKIEQAIYDSNREHDLWWA